MRLKSYEELSKAVEDRGGVLTCDMGTLRDVHGAGKLGVNVVANISEALDHRGLSHLPDPLPVNQWEKARIYKRGSAIGDLIQAAYSVDEDSDKVLRKLAADSSRDTIKKIRELVCD